MNWTMLPSVEIASQYKHYTGFSTAIIQNAKQLAKSNKNYPGNME